MSVASVEATNRTNVHSTSASCCEFGHDFCWFHEFKETGRACDQSPWIENELEMEVQKHLITETWVSNKAFGVDGLHVFHNEASDQ